MEINKFLTGLHLKIAVNHFMLSERDQKIQLGCCC